MKAITCVVGLLLAAVPAFSQSRVYTNADLGKYLTSSVRLDPAAAAAILAPHAFVFVPQAARSRGPRVGVFGSPTAGPFGEFAPYPEPTRLDGRLLWNRPRYVFRAPGNPQRSNNRARPGH